MYVLACKYDWGSPTYWDGAMWTNAIDSAATYPSVVRAMRTFVEAAGQTFVAWNNLRIVRVEFVKPQPRLREVGEAIA